MRLVLGLLVAFACLVPGRAARVTAGKQARE